MVPIVVSRRFSLRECCLHRGVIRAEEDSHFGRRRLRPTDRLIPNEEQRFPADESHLTPWPLEVDCRFHFDTKAVTTGVADASRKFRTSERDVKHIAVSWTSVPELEHAQFLQRIPATRHEVAMLGLVTPACDAMLQRSHIGAQLRIVDRRRQRHLVPIPTDVDLHVSTTARTPQSGNSLRPHVPANCVPHSLHLGTPVQVEPGSNDDDRRSERRFPIEVVGRKWKA
jgi:hypothetical protein